MNNEQNQNNQNLETLNQNIPPSIDPLTQRVPTQSVENLGSTPPSVTPIPPVDSINLQPEGVVPPIPNNVPPAQNGVEPLMSTTLTPETSINNFTQPVQSQNMNNSMMQNQMNQQPNLMGNMGMNQNIMPNNQMNIMGGVPIPPPLPSEEPGKKEKKKGNNKILLIILVVVLILGIGFGVYYFLVASKAKTKILINTTRVEAELGSELELVAANFATVDGYDINSCTVNTNLDINTYGTYQYSVTCGNVTSEAKTIMVRDTQAPVVTLKDVIVIPNAAIEAEDFLEKVEDASEYTVALDAEVDTSTPGTYEVTITISDEYENVTTVKGNLIVDENAPTTYLVCQKEQTEEDPTITNRYRFGISGSGSRYDTKKIVTFTYEKEEDYKEAVNEYEENKSINNISGTAKFDMKNFTITITSVLEDSFLTKELGVDTLPTNEDEIQTIFDNSCELSLN